MVRIAEIGSEVNMTMAEFFIAPLYGISKLL
jgi:hypothetical protein